VNNNKNQDKLKALLEGLEVKNIDLFIEWAGVSDYRLLGEKMAIKTKELKETLNDLGKAIYFPEQSSVSVEHAINHMRQITRP
jgi:hypothetical protein